MCKCTPFAKQLIEQGFFPTASSQPNLTVSILFLKCYRTLFEHTGDTVTAIAATLSNFYNRQGYLVVDKKVSLNNCKCFIYLHYLGGAYCGSLPQVIWHSSTVLWMSAWGDPPITAKEPSITNLTWLKPSATHAAWPLQRRCPACFRSPITGQSFKE